MSRHAIHLGTAWEPPTAEAMRWLRCFGRPTGIEPGDRVVLVCQGAARSAAWQDATLNDGRLGWHAAADGGLECDVTDLLAERNLLVVPVSDPQDGVADRGRGARATLPAAWGRLSMVVVSD